MNPRAFHGFDCTKKDTYESLKKEYDNIKNDIFDISQMELSDKAKELPLKELNERIDEIKERMHNYIDSL